ncbi:ParB/RepB/Spo0J family partition protein, partial [Klebsiella pneumoniae]|uniref:ParB/RepB/Spo0J family partition protein n=2 Tax=Klebsiella/Raoultella group TaxID=2890311 RepID=UPI001C9B582F
IAKDMKANGYKVDKPVDVAIVNGKMIIIDGHHRAEVARKAGMKDIPSEFTLLQKSKVINYCVKPLKQG